MMYAFYSMVLLFLLKIIYKEIIFMQHVFKNHLRSYNFLGLVKVDLYCD